METIIYDLQNEYEKAIDEAAKVIQKGGLVVIPTETVYGLAADARNESAVKRIFHVKGRPQDNPLIVHIQSFEELEGICENISDMAKKAMNAFWPGPFTAVLKKHSSIPDTVTAGLHTVAVRMPACRPARDLIKKSGKPLAAPSANLSGRPSPTRAEHAKRDLNGKVPIILDGGACEYGVESTVCDLTGTTPVILRPGGITPALIEREMGSVKLHPALLNKLQQKNAPSPGMKYLHYSPRAKVVVVDADDTNTIAIIINRRYDIDKKNGHTPVIFCKDSHAPFYENRNVCALGNNIKDMASNLFYELRRADERGEDIIYFEAVKADGMGLALMDRILRAAGFDIIRF